MTSTFLHCPAPPFPAGSHTGLSPLHPSVVVHVLQTPRSQTGVSPAHFEEHSPVPPLPSAWPPSRSPPALSVSPCTVLASRASRPAAASVAPSGPSTAA